MKFLETITFFGNDALVPIDRIKYINLLGTENGFKIVVVSDDGDWEEHFTDAKKANKRYDMIKEIVEAK